MKGRLLYNSAIARSWFNALRAPLSRESALGFFLRLLLGISVFIFFPLPKEMTYFLEDSTAFVVGAILQMMGYKVTSSGHLVLEDEFSVRIILQCTGFFEAAIFSACVLAYPTTFAKKLFGLCLGLGIIYWFNIFRIMGAFLIGASFPSYFELSHIWMFTSLSLALVVMLWIYWIDRVTGQELDNKVSFLCKFLLSTAFLFIVWAKVGGIYYFLLKTVVGAILPMVVASGTGNLPLSPGDRVFVVFPPQVTGLSIVGIMAFIFCLSPGRYMRMAMYCSLALIGLFVLNLLENVTFVLACVWHSCGLGMVSYVIRMVIVLAPLAVALTLLYRPPGQIFSPLLCKRQ